ncbi:MAG: hypothetical protein WKG03_10960, partial [Telluria sp.]
RSVRFLTDPDALGRARRIVVGPTEFAVSGDMSRIDVLLPFGAVSGKIRLTNDTGAGASPSFRVPLASPASLIARAVSTQAEQVFSISDDASWLTVLPGRGMTPGTVMAGIDTFGLKAGRYVGVVTVRSGNPATLITAAVELMVNAPAGAVSIVVEPEFAAA